MLTDDRRGQAPAAGGIALEPDGRDEPTPARSPSEQAPADDRAGSRRRAARIGTGPDRLLVARRASRSRPDLDALAAMVAQPDTRLWVDLTDPTEQRPGRREDARSAPADRRGHRGGQPAGEGRGQRRPGPCRAVRPRVPRRGPARPRSTSCWASSSSCSAHGSATDLARRVTMRDGVGAVLANGTDLLLWAIADRSSTATSR